VKVLSDKQNESRSFMYGAIILLIANALVKIIGAIFKIPLTYILGEEGMGYFSTSYQMYTWMFILATAGIPVAISKMVSESNARGDKYEINRIFSVSMKLLAIIGVVGFSFLFFGAEFCAGTLLNNPGAASGIRAIAPAMLFVSLMSAYRGYFQGHQNMIPTAFSEVSEALGKLVIGFTAAYLLLPNGIELASAGAVAGVSCGGLAGFVVLALMYSKHKKQITDVPHKLTGSLSDGQLFKKLVAIAIPITIGASVFSLTSLIDTAMIMHRLQAGGFPQDVANRLWGSYSGYAFPLFNLPPTLINAITVSIVPAIAAAFASGDKKLCAHTSCKSMKITVLFALPCSVGMSLLARPILSLVYDNTNATSTLSILACAIVFVSLVLVTNAILQATGKAMIPVRNMIIGGIVKVIINYFLVANPNININGAPVGTSVCYMVILVLNIVDMKRTLGLKFPVGELVFKPVVAACAMAAALIFVTPFFEGMGRIVEAAAPIAVGAVVYLLVIVLIKGINEEDIALLPKADKLTKVCKKIKIIR